LAGGSTLNRLKGIAMAYATAGELETYTGNAAPANATVLVYRASRKVDELLMCAVYDVDSGGLPTNLRSPQHA
jgi:hypothetical protein